MFNFGKKKEVVPSVSVQPQAVELNASTANIFERHLQRIPRLRQVLEREDLSAARRESLQKELDRRIAYVQSFADSAKEVLNA